MFSSIDHYQATKPLKKLATPLPPPFHELAAWIEQHYGVRVLNLVYDTVIPDDRPRLSVILDTTEDSLKFRDVPYSFICRIAEGRILEQFNIIFQKTASPNFKVDGLFVAFMDFENSARAEANASITPEEISHLKSDLANEDLWEISRSFDGVTFFFFTEEQKERHEAAGLNDEYARAYSRLIQRYDEFGYLQKCGITMHFDSKENFDYNYQGNWHYYYK